MVLLLLLLTFALSAQSAWAQSIGPLVLDDRQQSKGSPAERAAAVRPPSLQLGLPAPAAVAALAPLGPADLQHLQPQESGPPIIGVHRPLPAGAATLSSSKGRVETIADGAWQPTAVGPLWRLGTTSPGARAMRVHFRDFAVGAGSLWLHSADGQIAGPYSGSGPHGDGDFWSNIVFGDSLTIEYLPVETAPEEAVPFQIVAISHIWDAAFGGGGPPEATAEVADTRGALKPLPDRIDVVTGTQSVEQFPASNDPPNTKMTRLARKGQWIEQAVSLRQPHPQVATTLTPGQSVNFSLGPVDNPTLFAGDFSFRLEVPANATRVTFTLESANPAVDVDLYARFGEDIALQNERPVSDHASEGRTGNERIDITSGSNPPLRAGTYFVAFALFDTGVVADCTLTAEVETDGETPQPQPQMSGRPLTPGQPANFSLGPVDNATLFVGNFSFRLEVPTNASRVTFTLESSDDLALYVRYGQDNDVQDGGSGVLYARYGQDNDVQDGWVVTDYSSNSDRFLSGTERVVITRQSDPPLRAGTYFVSFGVHVSSVVVEGTLTARVEMDGEVPQPQIGGGPLTPGQPADFSLGPVDLLTLFTGDFSFRLEVPENATRLTFTLESVDPDVDVDLYVRFGEDNAIPNGNLVFDYFSRGFNGNERIVITRRSAPPLRAGTYFVSIAVRDTGVIAEGTLTATLETDAQDCHPDVTCYSEWSSSALGVATILFETDGGTSRCSGTLLNNSRQDFTPYFLTAAHCVDSEEQARSVTAFWFYQTQTCNGALPGFQSVPRTERASLIATLGGGLIEGRANPDGDMTLLRLEGGLPDGVIFQGWDANPQPLGTQVAGIHHPGNADWGFFKRISFGQIVPDPYSRVPNAVHAVVSYTRGYLGPGSSGSALFSSPGTVVGAASFVRGGVSELENACRTGSAIPVRGFYTRFSVFYPHIRQFIGSEPPTNNPAISSGGVVLATGTPIVNRISPNSIVTVFGEFFAPQGTQAVNPQLDGAGKIATELAGTCLEIGGVRAPLFAVFPTQINAQAPHLLQAGQATVEVIRGCGAQNEQRSPAETVSVAPLAPAFFNFVTNPDGRNPIVALHGSGSGLAGAPGLIPGVTFTPAAPGEFVVFYGTGFGATDPPLEAGQIPVAALPGLNGVARLTGEVSFSIGGIAVPPEDVYYAGTAPCCAGLYQFTARVPLAAADGDLAVSATVNGVTTPKGPFLTVQGAPGMSMIR